MIDKNFFIEDFDRAIEENRIHVHYQPIVRSTTGRICGEETLSRWVGKNGEVFVPDDFIPQLEEAGLICKLDLYVVEQLLKKLRKQDELGMFIVQHSVNLSEKDLIACDMPEEIRRRVDAAGIPRELIVVEIEENAIKGDYTFIKEQIDRFHELGFKVCLDGFENNGFSQDLFRSFSLDMIKFNLDYIRKFESEEPGRIILSELMKMTIGLGIDTVCEGVETKEEEQFLCEIGCEKLQGYLYSQAITYEDIVDLYRTRSGIRQEDPEESTYYDEIGRINLYDLAVLAKKDEGSFSHYFNTIPMAILEIEGESAKFVRTNQSYRDFAKEILGLDVENRDEDFDINDKKYPRSFMKRVLQCCKDKDREIISERLPGKLTVRSFVRWLADNPITGASAIVVAVISISDADQETTYENIARTLAADYFMLFYVDLDTGHFIEYTADTGEEDLAIERSGSDFLNTIYTEARETVAEDDLENFMFTFTTENILRSLDTQGTFTMTFHMIIDKEPVKVSLKARRMQAGDSHIIIGINIIDEQAKLEDGYERKVISSALNGTAAAGMESISLNSAAFAVKSCIKLMQPGDFKENVRAVLKDIRELSRSDSARVLLVDGKKKEASVFAEANRDSDVRKRLGHINELQYGVIVSWENLTGDNNAVIINNEADRKELEKRCPEWAQLMQKDRVDCLVLVPLKRDETLLGYLYVLNHETRKTEKIREVIELVSYFLSSELSNYMFRRELEILSNFDQLTGLKNRYAMFQRIGRLENSDYCCFGILTMDLNGLKTVNDTQGHMAGDNLILSAARVLEKEFGREDLYRIGGDEFIVLFTDVSEEDFEKRVSVFLEGRLKESGVSMAYGTAWSDQNENMEPFFHQADQNMYANKKELYRNKKKAAEKAIAEG